MHPGNSKVYRLYAEKCGRIEAQRDFEIKRVPEIYRVKDRYLNMKGRRLASLKTGKIRLVLKPAAKGNFTLKLRRIYLDKQAKISPTNQNQ